MSKAKESKEFQELATKRKIFEETKESNEVFNEYQKSIKVKKQSSILFCVIGGRLSEGINFSDELARAVIVCGLPFANS
jgi:chromosome transmission fidelity protein 1